MASPAPVSAIPFAPVIVSGQSDPWLAGMPNGSSASGGSDIAPTHSPVLIPGLSLTGGSTITFTVSGFVKNSPGCCATGVGADGYDGLASHAAGPENGIANVTAPFNSLIGLFLTNDQPSLSVAPSGLDFTSNLNFASLAPGLKQPFFIGDGLTGVTLQSFIVPNGATRLFLGTMDSFEWSNNSGTFNVSGDLIAADLAPIPEPATLLLFAATAAGLGWARRKRSAS